MKKMPLPKAGDRCWVADYGMDYPHLGFLDVVKVEERKDKLGRDLGYYVTLQGKPEYKPIQKRVIKSYPYLYGYSATPSEAVIEHINEMLDMELRDGSYFSKPELRGETQEAKIECAKKVAEKLKLCIARWEQAKKIEQAEGGVK